MISHHHHDQAPYAPAREYLIPGLSLALSIPTLIVDILVIFHTLTGHDFDISAPTAQVSSLAFAFGCLYIVFGPILGGFLCITQRTHAEQAYGSVHLLGFRMKRLNTIALYVAALALGLLLFSALLTIIHNALTPGVLK